MAEMSMRSDAKTCKGATRYKTKQEASAVGLKLHKPSLRVRCARCGDWHLRTGRRKP